MDDALRTTLSDILSDGDELTSRQTGEKWLELLSYQTGMRDPRKRILGNHARRLDLVGAVGRFVWMLRGDDSLSTISYYAPRAEAYSPDGISLPGSNYGGRIRRSLPGVDQLDGVIARLRQDAHSRQAATVIWNPMDAVREQFDIPCAFGTFYHCREGGLIGTTVMRSNKPSVMPVNFFEFSMLAEVVAGEIGVPLRRYVHWVSTLQLPERERANAEAAVCAEGESHEMPAMPSHPAPLEQIRVLVKLEEKLRTSRTDSELVTTITQARDTLHPYWMSFAEVLAIQCYVRADRIRDARRAAELLPGYFAEPVQRSFDKRFESNSV
jgi:thymidylate synthase